MLFLNVTIEVAAKKKLNDEVKLIEAIVVALCIDEEPYLSFKDVLEPPFKTLHVVTVKQFSSSVIFI